MRKFSLWTSPYPENCPLETWKIPPEKEPPLPQEKLFHPRKLLRKIKGNFLGGCKLSLRGILQGEDSFGVKFLRKNFLEGIFQGGFSCFQEGIFLGQLFKEEVFHARCFYRGKFYGVFFEAEFSGEIFLSPWGNFWSYSTEETSNWEFSHGQIFIGWHFPRKDFLGVNFKSFWRVILFSQIL